MRVACPGCHSVYNVKDETVPLKGTKAKCPKCGSPIRIEREPSAIINPEDDYAKTMVLFMPVPAQLEEQEEAVESGIAGREPALPAGHRFALKVIEGDRPGAEYPIRKPVTVIGRKKADIILDDPEVSRRHAEVAIYGERAVIRDLGSTNGTFVNGVAVRLSDIGPGDRVQVGNTVLEVLAG